MSCLLGSSSKVSDGEKRERSREKRHVERRTLLRQEQTYQRFLSAASIHIGMVKEHISSGPPCTAMQVVPAQGHEQGLKSSPSSPCHALPPGEEDCICPVWCNLKWQPCIKMIFKPVSPMEGQEHVDTSREHNLLPLWGMWQGTCCIPPQLCTQAAVTSVTLLTFGLILEVVEGRGQEAVAEERISQQLSNYFQSRGYRSKVSTGNYCVYWSIVRSSWRRRAPKEAPILPESYSTKIENEISIFYFLLQKILELQGNHFAL